MKKVIAIIRVLVIAIVGVVLLTMNVNTSQDPVNLAEISARDLENKTLYYAEELVIMDAFASTDDEDVLYMAVMFEDEAGEYVVVDMPVNKDDGIWDAVRDYLDDDSQQMGDYVVSCYVMTEKHVNVDGKLFDLFDEWMDDLKSAADFSVSANTELRFNYLCDEDGDPAAEIGKSNIVFTIVGIICLVLALVMLYFSVLRRPKAITTAYAKSGYTPPQSQNPSAYTIPSCAPVQPQNSLSAEQLYLEAQPYKFMGKTPDFKRAFDLHLQAANMGYAPAQYEVGYAYALGFGVSKDEQSAFQWYLRAAQQGHTTAQRNVGQRYSSGLGTYPDPLQARYWYQRAAEGNDASAMLALGKMYEDGIGGEQNLSKALELYKQAAEKGSQEAQNAYAQLAARQM